MNLLMKLYALPRPKPCDFELGVQYVNQGNEHRVPKQSSSWTEQRFYLSSPEDAFVLKVSIRIRTKYTIYLLTSGQIILHLYILFRGHTEQRGNTIAIGVPVRAPPGQRTPRGGRFIVRHADMELARSKLGTETTDKRRPAPATWQRRKGLEETNMRKRLNKESIVGVDWTRK